MRISTRFSIAVHVLSLLGMEFTPEPTSEFMATSIGVNPVVVRNVTAMLKRAGLVTSCQGKAGTHLAAPLDRITLLDVYRAVDVDTDLFAIHPNPHPDCPVGCQIQGELQHLFTEAQRAMEDQLGSTTIAQIVDRMRSAA